jgi:hypothetical protein
MTKTKNECVDTARQALNLFTGDELHDYINKVASRSRELQRSGTPFPRDAAIKEINQGHLASMLDDSARAARNMSKYDTIKTKMDSGIDTQSFLEKTSKNTDYNIETANNAAKQVLHHKSFGKMSKEELEILTKGEMDDSVYAVADGMETDNPLIRSMGESLRAYPDSRNAMLIQSDAMKPQELNEDRYFRNTYNPSKLNAMGKENWVALQKSLIDIEGTFKNTKAMNTEGEIDDAIVTQMIGNSFDNIIQGNGVLFTKPVVSKDWAKIERTRHMFYKYKDWKSYGMANKEFGQGSLFKSWLMDINMSGQQTGMAQIMGSAPEMMYNEMRHIQVAKNPVTPLNSVQYSLTDSLFNNLLGVNKGAWNPTVANIGSSIRSLSSMARLGKIVLRSIPDISNIGGMAQRAGAGYWAPYFNAIANAFNLMPGESRIILARTMSSSLNVHMGTVSRYIDTAGMGDTVSRLSNKFFHGVGLDAWDKGNKLSAMDPVMKTYGKDSTKSFEALNNQQQSWLKRFNISDHEWDALRSKTEKRLFSTDNVDNLTDSELRALWNKSDKIVPLSDYRQTLYRKVFGMFDTLHEFSVLNPTAYTNMITTGNLRAGTAGGEAMRMIMQFKGYPIQYMKRVWVGGMQDFDSYQARMMYALNMSLGTMMLASLSEVLVAIAGGLTPPDPTKMSRSEQIKYYGKILAGGLGIFGTILNDKATAKTVTASLVATPSIRFAADPFISAIALATGDLKGAKKNVKDWINVANPIGTVPVISNYVDSFLGNKPYTEPGQKPLF